jgi:primosomal protein N' (replication factor Y)
MWVQTCHPQHPLYAALKQHDFAAFATSQLAEREAAGLPPYSHLALLRAESRDAAVALAWLQAAAALADGLPGGEGVTVYPPVPPAVSKVAGIERLQMLVEAPSRARLQQLLAGWMPALHGLRSHHRGLARWAVDVDPLAI